ncbi:MAG: hydrogenase small subunit [Deferribacterota bacterium]|nr:hydrogenase small subunit [Deferribacterota bacterium]
MEETKSKLFNINRRDFIKYCTIISGILGLPPIFTPKIAEALESDSRPPVIWLEFQDCAGDTEALLRANSPSAGELILEYISLDYHETIMSGAGTQAEKSKDETFEKYRGKYICIVEGSIPTAENGVYCTVAGKTALNTLKEVGGNAAVVVAVGTCATYGGIPAAYPNPTMAKGVDDIINNVPVVNLPGCPVNVDNLTATIVHYLIFNAIPALDNFKRPRFAYGKRIHDNCERRAHFDAGQFVEKWGDSGHRSGWCLYKMGCKGPETFHNCPTVRYNDGLSWPVMAGHGCVGCSEPAFWDTMTPIYKRLPNVPGFGVEASATKIGAAVVGISAAVFGIHGIVSAIRHRDFVKKKTKEYEEKIDD